MQIDGADMVKIVSGLFSAGAGWSAFKPVGAMILQRWLESQSKRDKAEEDKAKAFERISVQMERQTGVLERMADILDRNDARLDRVEAHLGISITPSAIPAPVPTPHPRADITGEHRAVLPSSPASQRSSPS